MQGFATESGLCARRRSKTQQTPAPTIPTPKGPAASGERQRMIRCGEAYARLCGRRRALCPSSPQNAADARHSRIIRAGRPTPPAPNNKAAGLEGARRPDTQLPQGGKPRGQQILRAGKPAAARLPPAWNRHGRACI